jgi:hypothetical protein
MLIEIPNETDADHLEEVKAEMITRGSPKIRVLDGGDVLIAIEGSHRVSAAAALGIPVEVVIIDDDDKIDLDTLDWDDCGWFDDRVVTLRDFVDRFCVNRRGEMVEVDVVRI